MPKPYADNAQISTGTSVAPFLQFLSLLKSQRTTSPGPLAAAAATTPTAAPKVRSTPTETPLTPLSPIESATPTQTPETRTLPAMTSYDQPIKTSFSIFQSKSTPPLPHSPSTILQASSPFPFALNPPSLSDAGAIPTSELSSPSLHLIHAAPKASKPDWVIDSNLLLPLQMKHDQLIVQRFPHGEVARHAVQKAVQGMQDQRLLVIVSLPPK